MSGGREGKSDYPPRSSHNIEQWTVRENREVLIVSSPSAGYARCFPLLLATHE